MPVASIKITRDILASFLPNHDTIKQFENILLDIQTLPDDYLSTSGGTVSGQIIINFGEDGIPGLVINATKVSGDAIRFNNVNGNEVVFVGTDGSEEPYLLVKQDSGAKLIELNSDVLTLILDELVIKNLPTSLNNIVKFQNGASADQVIIDNAGQLITYNNIIFNALNGDFDFSIGKNTSGKAMNYDAGLDKLDLDSSLTTFTAPVNGNRLSAQPTYLEPLAIATTKYVEGTTTRVTSATYTVLASDTEVFCNTDANGTVLSLLAGVNDKRIRITNTGSSSNILEISPNGAEHLLGENSSFYLLDGESLTIRYNSTDGWY